MKHEYDDETIFKAMVKASDEYRGIRGMISAPFEAFLNALPDQADDWQAKGAEVVDVADVRIGDRVLLKSVEGSLYEVTITSITTIHEVMLYWNDGRIYESSIERAYLFNRPVQHPDPAEHPVIIVRSVAEPRAVVGGVYVWTGYAYVSIDGSVCYLDHTEITDWNPAKVIADE